MDVSTVVNNKKPCPVCVYLKAYPKELSLEVNNLIFSNSKYKDILEFLEKSNVLNNKQKPSKHFVEKHRTDCLGNFKIPIEKIIIEKNKPSYEDINISLKVEEYRKMSLEEKNIINFDLLSEIQHMTVIMVHHQLLHGKIGIKANVPKEDIQALKIINDVFKELKLKDEKNEDENIFTVMSDEQIKHVYEMYESAKKQKSILT